MLRKKPLVATWMTMMLVPFAAPLYARAQTTQTVAAPSPASAAGAAASGNASGKPAVSGNQAAQNAQLPAVQVTGQAVRDDFQTARSSVGGKVAKDPLDIAQSTTSVNKALLQSQAATSFQDALRNVPGITLGAAEGGQIGNNINLRGFSASTDIYLDGFRDPGQYYRDTFDLESIDVLYGPSSLYFGRGSTGGVINQVSKVANLKQSAEVTAMAGTHDRYRSSFDINQPLTDTVAFRLNGFGQSLGSTRDVMKNKDFGFAPTVSFGIGTPTELTLSALIQHNDDQPDYGIQSVNAYPAPVSRSAFYGFTNDRTIQDVQTFSARLTHRFNDAFTLRNQTQFSHYATDARETSLKRGLFTGPSATSKQLGNGDFTTLPLSDLYVGLVSRDRVINDHSVYNSTTLEGKLGHGWVKNDVLAGVDIGHETYTNQGYTSTGPGLPSGTLAIVPLLDPPYNPRPAGTKTVPANLAESSATSLGIYANDTVSLGKYWKVVGGVRWDRYEASISNTVSAPAQATQTNFFTSVRGGVIYQPTDWSSYYASYGTSFDPSLEALTLTSGQQNLAPEHNKSYEVGSKWDLLGGNLSVAQSLFQTEQNNARTQNSDGTYTLDGDIKVKGYQLGVVGHITPKWQIYGGYTYLDSRIVRALDGTEGNQLANTPRHTITLWTTYKFTPHWEIGGGPVYLSSRYAVNDNVVHVGGYVRWDAMAAYHAKKYDVQLNLLNLTNKYYYDGLIASDGGRAIPGIGRTFLATVDYRF